MEMITALLVLCLLYGGQAQNLCTPNDTVPGGAKCVIEVGQYGLNVSSYPESFKMMEFNIDRGIDVPFGNIIKYINSSQTPPDVIFIIEADRGCHRSNGVNQMQTLALWLGMNYVYGPEFVEIGKGFDGPSGFGCTTGNGILSRFPIANPRMFRFDKQCCFFPDRAGGRSTPVVDIVVDKNKGKIMRAYGVHLESGNGAPDQLKASIARLAQTREILEDIQKNPFSGRTVISGDFNVLIPDDYDPVIWELLNKGFTDAHSSLPNEERWSCFESGGVLDIKGVCDYLFSKPKSFLNPGIGNVSSCAGCSDHVAIWATFQF